MAIPGPDRCDSRVNRQGKASAAQEAMADGPKGRERKGTGKEGNGYFWAPLDTSASSAFQVVLHPSKVSCTLTKYDI
jgi:hypothetical protein